MKKFIIILIIFITSGLLSCFVFKTDIPLFSPFWKNDFNIQLSDFEIIGGFLPYWTLSKLKYSNYFNNLYYFSFKIESNGDIVTDSKKDLGFYRLQNNSVALNYFNAKQTKIQKGLTITQFNNNDIESFLNSSESQENFLTQIKPFFDNNQFNNLVIDIEYSGSQSARLRPQFTDFINLVQTRLKDKKDFVLSVCVYARSATYQQIWDIADLSNKINYFIIMAYDYFNSSSLKPGPVSPINDTVDHNILFHLKSFLKLTEANKLVLALPLYGYGWQVDNFDLEIARTTPNTGFSISLEQLNQLENKIKANDWQVFWDEQSSSPYVFYQEEEKKYIIFFENTRSLQLKVDLAKKLGLKGVAFWALGYEGVGFDWSQIFNVNLKK